MRPAPSAFFDGLYNGGAWDEAHQGPVTVNDFVLPFAGQTEVGFSLETHECRDVKCQVQYL